MTLVPLYETLLQQNLGSGLNPRTIFPVPSPQCFFQLSTTDFLESNFGKIPTVDFRLATI